MSDDLELSQSRGGSKNWLSIASMLVTVTFGSVLTGWLSLVDRKVDEARLTLEKLDATSTYMGLLAERDGPDYLKSMALASMLRFDLMDADLLFSSGYMMENELGPGILLQLFYEYGQRSARIASPIGYLQLPGQRVENAYRLYGWAIDDHGALEIETSFDRVSLGLEPTTGLERKDIALLFPYYPEGSSSGFLIELPGDFEGREGLLGMRLIDEDFHYMEILATRVCFLADKVDRCPPDSVDPPRQGAATVPSSR